jgi:hypothetical protein
MITTKSYAKMRSFLYFRSMSRNYKFHNKAGLYFVSFATVNWIDVFTRQLYFDVLAESINYCRAEKGMELYCNCPFYCLKYRVIIGVNVVVYDEWRV